MRGSNEYRSNGRPRNFGIFKMLKWSCKLMPNWIVVSLVVILAVTKAFAFQCPGENSPFGILPEGDRYVNHGESVTLFCILNMNHTEVNGYTSKDLYFYILKGETELEPEITIVNSTAISTTVKNLSLGQHWIYCSPREDKRKNCRKYVEVGLKPREVKNFTCVSPNWESLECEWDPPPTYITSTKYELKLLLSRNRISHACMKGENKKKNSCVFTSTRDPFYRQAQQFFTFHLEGKNPLGNYTTIKKFNHFAHVKPNKPEDIGLFNSTFGSATIKWNVSLPLNRFRPGIRTKIKYRSKYDPRDTWKETPSFMTGNTSTGNRTHLYNLTGLDYAHTLYEVKIYLQSGAAIGDSLWSEPGTFSFITPSTIPGKPPDTTFGSYDIIYKGNESDVIVYWSRIPEFMENGENFGYNVTCLMNNKYNCDPPLEKTLSYAKYALLNNNEYLFSIYSVNDKGRSINSTQVFVPKLGSIPRPERLANVPHANNIHELSWKAVDHKHLSNYTIFWCEDEQDLPLPCKGIIKWIDVGKNATDRNITMKSVVYKFAIAANFINGTSSGMVWFSCLVLHDKVNKEVSSLIIGNTGSREVSIVWEMECAHRSSYAGYQLYYCPVLSTPSNDCRENYPEQKLTVKEFEERNITLRNLKPYTTYRVQISVVSYNGTEEKVGPRSKPVRFTTLEDAPSEPLNLRNINTTNSSIILIWDGPLEKNGILQKYKLDVESQSSRERNTYTFEAKDLSNSQVTHFEIAELSSYTKYKFSLRACTVKCSKPSSPIILMTRAGIPGKMAWPRIVFNNNSMAVLAWERPSLAAGGLNYYELSVSVNGSHNKIINYTDTRAEVPLTDCNTTFKIRAINIDGNEIYEGPWSEPVSSRCDSKAWSDSIKLLAWIACLCMVTVISGVLFYIVKRGWLHCRKMKNVEIKLPPGLQSQDLEKDNQDYLNMEKWPPRPSDTIPDSLGPDLAPDEESLLGKKTEECLDQITPFNVPIKNCEDSSGYSVGRDSVSSSVASDNHASSDSGAVADQCLHTIPTYEYTVPTFEEWNSLKMEPRNLQNDSRKNEGPVPKISHVEEPVNFSNVNDWNAGDPAGYTRVGFTDGPTSDKSLPQKGYVTIGHFQKANNEDYSLGLGNFPLLLDHESETSDTKRKSFINPPPSYMTLACLQERNTAESNVPGAMQDSCRPSTVDCEESRGPNKDPHEYSQFETSLKEGGKEFPMSGTSDSMPSYVSMIDNPIHSSVNGEGEKVKGGGEEEERGGKKKEVEEDGEEVAEEESSRFSPNVKMFIKKNGNENGGALLERLTKGSESYSNYIPHRVFEKETHHTQ